MPETRIPENILPQDTGNYPYTRMPKIILPPGFRKPSFPPGCRNPSFPLGCRKTSFSPGCQEPGYRKLSYPRTPGPVPTPPHPPSPPLPEDAKNHPSPRMPETEACGVTVSQSTNVFNVFILFRFCIWFGCLSSRVIWGRCCMYLMTETWCTLR